MSYTKTVWENSPSTQTPINAENLNHMEQGIKYAYDIADDLDPRMDLVEQRLDNLIPQGTPTEGNAELIDIRVGGNGTTYPDAGSAVRGQYGELKSALTDMFYVGAKTSLWVQGGIASSNGVRVDAQNRIRSSSPLDDTNFSVTPNNGYKICVFLYNLSTDAFIGVWNGVSTQVGSLYWFTTQIALSSLIANYKVRIVGAKTDDSNITTAAATNFIFETRAIPDLINRIGVAESDIDKLENQTEVVLPNKLYGVVGQEFDLYKYNALLYGDEQSVADVRYMQYINGYIETKKMFKCVPNATSDGYAQFKLYKDNLVAYDVLKNIKMIVSNPSILNGLTRNIVIIGDSKTAGGRLPKVLKDLCTDAGMTVGDLFGSLYNSTFGVNTEGRSGWSSADYMTSGRGGVTNPFYNNGSFDFSYWMAQQGYNHMDYVFINLGTNDYAASDGLGSDAYINTFISNINAMITSIHSYDADIKIVIGLAEGVCTSQYSDLSDDKLNCLNTRAKLLNKACIAEWNNSTAEGNKVWVCPIYLSMDMENDYLMEEVSLTQWDATYETGKTLMKVTDKMHQNSVGYAKNATYMFSLLTYIESLT